MICEINSSRQHELWERTLPAQEIGPPLPPQPAQPFAEPVEGVGEVSFSNLKPDTPTGG